MTKLKTQLDVKRDFGALGDGTSDDTAAIQAALNAADATNSRAVYFPSGTYLTGPLTWRLQSLIGETLTSTILLGKPSQDILSLDQTVSQTNQRQRTVVDRLIFRVNDSVNASASFTNRSGVGNAAISVDRADNSVATGLALYNVQFGKVRIESLSGTAKNRTCGIYQQRGGGGNTILDLSIARLDYGWWMDSPVTNLTSIDYSFDDNVIESFTSELNTYAARFYNMAYSRFGRFTVHNNNGSGAYGPEFGGFQALTRKGCFDIDMGVLFVESDNAPLTFANTTGFNCRNAAFSGNHSSTTIACQDSAFESLSVSNIGTTGTQLILAGDRIRVKKLRISGNSTAPMINDQVQFLGVGNTVETVAYTTGSSGRNRIAQTIDPNLRTHHQRDSISGLLGYTSQLATSGNDWLVDPDSINGGGTEGVDYTRNVDLTTEFNKNISFTAGSFASITVGGAGLNGEQGTLMGYFLPIGKVRVYVKAKLGTAGNQAWFVKYGGANTIAGSSTVALTTGYSVLSFDADLSAASVGDTVLIQANTPSGGGAAPLTIAWVMFRPYFNDLLVANGITGPGRSLSASGTIANTDQTIVYTITTTQNQALPATSAVTAFKQFTLKNKSTSTATLYLTTAIDGVTNVPVAPGESLSIMSDGSAWMRT